MYAGLSPTFVCYISPHKLLAATRRTTANSYLGGKTYRVDMWFGQQLIYASAIPIYLVAADLVSSFFTAPRETRQGS